MIAKIENGMLFLIPESEEQRIEANKWYEETSKNYDEMSDFMVWVEQVPETFETYFKRLKQRRTEDEYKYTDEDFQNHIAYIEKCWRTNLSVYKCLEFMYFETQSKK